MMFNTGDIVRWREDGSLDTFGRSDDQVKIKGFRVELDGVSAVIEVKFFVYSGCTRLILPEISRHYASVRGGD